jgi:hypothetical protein
MFELRRPAPAGLHQSIGNDIRAESGCVLKRAIVRMTNWRVNCFVIVVLD